MAATRGFTSLTAARTRTATHILSTPDLLALFATVGGLPIDLEPIRDAGLEAEAFNQAQGSMQSNGKVATVNVGVAFSALQRDYVLLLAACRAILGHLLAANPKDPNAETLAGIIENRAAVTIVEGKEDGDPKKAAKSKAQENVRAEIERDAVDLIKFTAIAPLLAARGWTAARLNSFRDEARRLSGKLGDRTASKGAAQEATANERAAVTRQSAAWGAAYSLLRSLARKDARVSVLVAEAAR